MLQEIYRHLSATERKTFRKELAQRTQRGDRSQVSLLDALDAGKLEVLQRTMGTNAFHVATKRLSDRLLEFLGQHSILRDNPEETRVGLYLHVVQRLFAQGAHPAAWKILRKAEKLALQLQNEQLKLEVYRLAIHYSYLPGGEEQTLLFEKATQAERALSAALHLNMAYAQLRKQFQQLEYSQTRTEDLAARIQHTMDLHRIPEESLQSFQVLYQLAEIADLTAFRSKNYHLVDLYFAERVEALSGTPADGERTLLYHIDVRYLLAHIYFRQRKFEQCHTQLDRMYVQLQRYNQKYFPQRHIRWATLKALNLAYSGQLEAAEELLDQLLAQRHSKKEDLLNPQLVRAMLHFLSGRHKDVRRLLSGFQHGDSYYSARAGQEWVLNRRFMEILLYVELEEFDLADVRIRSLLRTYGKLFEQQDAAPVRPFLKLIQSYCQQPAAVRSAKFHALVEKSLPWKAHEEEDIFLMSFYAWLKSKMLNQPLYSVTLELVDGRASRMSADAALAH